MFKNLMAVSRLFPYEKIGFGAPFATFLMKTYGFEQSSCFSYENIRFEAFVFKLAKGGFGVRKQTRNRHIFIWGRISTQKDADATIRHEIA